MGNPLKKYRIFDKKLKKEMVFSSISKEKVLIRLFIKNEKQIYNDYSSLEKAEINNDIFCYLKEQAKYTHLKMQITVEIQNETKDQDIAQKIQDMLKENISEKIKGINKNLKRQLKIFYILGILGIIFLGLLFISENFGRFGMTELLSIICWVFIWRATEIYFFERKNTEYEKFKLMQLYFSKFKSYSGSMENIK